MTFYQKIVHDNICNNIHYNIFMHSIYWCRAFNLGIEMIGCRHGPDYIVAQTIDEIWTLFLLLMITSSNKSLFFLPNTLIVN